MSVKEELLKTCFCEHMENLIAKYPVDLCAQINEKALSMLQEIQDIVSDKNIDDFELAEKIVCVFEKYNIDFGARHDFG